MDISIVLAQIDQTLARAGQIRQRAAILCQDAARSKGVALDLYAETVHKCRSRWSRLSRLVYGASEGLSRAHTTTILRQHAREALRRGRLPNRPPDRTYGGHGTGSLCTICGLRTTKEETELEIEFDHDGSIPGWVRHYLHLRCFAAWEFERTKINPS